MDIKELRIGNYLQGQTTVVVSAILRDNRVEIEGNSSSFTVGVCLIPIPLTEDWLIKLGFKKNGNSYWFNNYMDITRLHTKDGRELLMMAFTDYSFELKSVHQLQNLYFALTGEELKQIEE